MKFLMINLSVKNNDLEIKRLETYLKEIPFSSKTKSLDKVFFNYILIPIRESLEEDENNEAFLRNRIIGKVNKEEVNSISDLLKNAEEKFPSIGIDIVLRTDSDKVKFYYSDGSFSKKQGNSSYAVCELTKDENGEKESFTNENFLFESFSDVIENSTNNIGELSGIEFIINRMCEKKNIVLIISDSEYSIKCFREWMYTWKNNNFKNYAGKEIANKDLITNAFNSMMKSESIFLFKWTKGHNKDTFNEICDKNAKAVLEEGKNEED